MPEVWIALYIFMLSAFVGFEVISRVPVILHTPLMSGTNFIHGIVLVGSLIVLMHAQTPLELAVSTFGVWLASLNVVGGFAVTDRMLAMFKERKG